MKPIKAIIIDDEERARVVLKKLFEYSSYDVEIVGEGDCLESALALVNQCKPDVVFLDIKMTRENGYEIAKYFEEFPFKLVFITAYNEYALKAFQINAFDYIVKPINRIRLDESLKRIYSLLNKERRSDEYERLMQNLFDQSQQNIIINESGNKHIIPISEIIAIESSGAYSNILLCNNKNLLVSKNLRIIEDELKEFSQMLRVHRGWIINTKYVLNFSKSRLSIMLKDDIVARLSKKKINVLESAF